VTGINGLVITTAREAVVFGPEATLIKNNNEKENLMKKMKKLNLPGLVTGLGLMLASNGLLAEAGISYTTGKTPTAVTADVKFKITIPKLMILRVGDWKEKVNTVEWTYAFGSSLTDPTANADADENHWNGANAITGVDSSTDDAADGSNGVLDVWAFGNTGSGLNLSVTSTTPFADVVTGANRPKLSEITATNGGSIAHPALADSGSGASPVTLAATAGIVSLKDTWTYKYTPTATPAAGTYEATVTYTLAAI